MRIRFVWAAVVPALFLATPAQAQWADFIPSVIANTIMSTMQSNNAEALCMRGNGPSSKRVNELKAASTVTMSGYFTAMQTGQSAMPFIKLNKNTVWSADGVVAGGKTMTLGRDPIAVPGATLVTDPLRYFVAGANNTGMGQWAVVDAQGGVLGVYTVMFGRQSGQWKIQTMTVSKADETVAPIVQYCRDQGDVGTFVEKASVASLNQLDHDIASLTERARLAEEKAVDSEAKAAASPKNATLKKLASSDRKTANSLQKKLVSHQRDRENVQRERDRKAAEGKRIAELTGPARNAMAFRNFGVLADLEPNTLDTYNAIKDKRSAAPAQ